MNTLSLRNTKAATVVALLFPFTASAFTTTLENEFPALVEGQAIADSVKLGIDPSALTLSFDAKVTAYFISEGAGYRNTVGWYDASTDASTAANRNVIWANASLAGSGGDLQPWQPVELGTFEAGTTLGFFLSANGFSYEKYRDQLSDARVDYYMDNYVNTYFTDDALNPDGISHVVAGLLPEKGLLTIGFEDLYGGGDRDYDDVVFAIDIGIENARRIAAGAPEPGEWALMLVGSTTLLGLINRRRRDRGVVTA
ncbi:MAG: DUF4114 domain-containing protein [Gammaproteobacteria bacterium]|nr:DUF4114 domain-containing protein [Gammaproteobacteria bacterium]MCP5136668.1 DUF4114 domain-containing protein [Gammaproteobacteria bacterium]